MCIATRTMIKIMADWIEHDTNEARCKEWITVLEAFTSNCQAEVTKLDKKTDPAVLRFFV
eukprot:COSAG02_NODE_3325_length_6935_cov_28.660913_2_plen_60_part_00